MMRSIVSNEIPNVFQKTDDYDKNFFIFTSAGKPIFSMYNDAGDDDRQVSSLMGIMTTIIDYFKLNNSSNLKMINSNVSGLKFIFLDKSPILLMGYSKRGETSDEILKQLDLLHSYILSTLNERQLCRLFTKRDNFDLRNFLEPTDFENLRELCHLMNGKLYPDLLINSLQCLPLRKSIRTRIHTQMLQQLTQATSHDEITRGTLLYGLIVSSHNKMCSVLRPRGHTLHTTDLQLLFSLIWNQFQNIDNTQELWVPICFPKFNSSGFLYCYIKFLSDEQEYGSEQEETEGRRPVLVLISASKDAFFPLKVFGNKLVDSLREDGLLDYIVHSRGFRVRDVPAPLVHHFIYKSKRHVQYVMPELELNENEDELSEEAEIVRLSYERKLQNYYQQLHNTVTSDDGVELNGSILNYIQWGEEEEEQEALPDDTSLHFQRENIRMMGLCWITPKFELYVICNNGVTDKEMILRSAQKIVSWCRRNESRLFIQDGAIF